MESYLDPDGVYLALGGGAARGLAHLGVLRALERHQIPIKGVAGASMGAWIGSCYALAPDADHLIQEFIDYVQSTHYQKARYAFMRNAQRRARREGRGSKLFSKLEEGILWGRSLTTGSIIAFDDFVAEINALLPNRTFHQTKLACLVVAADLSKRKEVVFNEGLLRSAVLASSAIPGAFPPVRAGETLYVDGGWVNKVPAAPLRHLGARNIIAIDVYHKQITSEVNTKRGFSIMTRANRVMERRLLDLQLEHASIVWKPPVNHLHWAEFTQIEEAVAIGEKFAEARIDEIKAMLDPPLKERWWRRLARRMIPPEPMEPPRYPFELRGIWDVREGKDSPVGQPAE